MNKIKFLLLLSFICVFLIFVSGMLALLKSDLTSIFNKQKLEDLKKIASILPNQFSQINKEEIKKNGIRLTLIDKNGDVLYDSKNDYSDTLLFKKEIKEGFGIRMDNDIKYLYASKKVPEGYIRIGIVEDNEFLTFLKKDFYQYTWLGVVILIVLILLISSKLLVPVKKILRFSHNFKQGNYKARINVEGSKDLELLSKSLNQMAKTIEESHLELELRREMIESVIKNFPLGIALMNQRGVLEVFNPRLEVLINQSLTAGRLYYENFYQSKIIEALQETYDLKQDVHVKIPMVSMERNAIYEISCNYIDGKVILVVTDITENEKLNQLKSQFISDVTHEFKTPIAIILGYLEVLEDKLSHEDKYYIQKSKNSLHRLTEIINDLVKLEKIEYSSLFGGLVEIRLKDLIEKSIEILKPYAEKKNIEIRTVILNENLKIMGLEEIIYYCIYNLIENSMKYNDKENGWVEIRLVEISGKAVISVIDNGPGIPQEYREDIFRRFFRVSKSRTNLGGQGGSGLGLSIVREGMRFHKGSVAAKDTSTGVGICFELTLPKA